MNLTVKIFGLAFLLQVLAVTSSFAQQCSNDSLLLFPPIGDDIAYSDPGFINPNNVPCLQSGVYSEAIIPFNTYDQGARLLVLPDSSTIPVSTIYSIKVESISNLPTGLCWTTSTANGTITGDQTGAIIIKGTTSAGIGIYPLSVKLSIDITGSGTFTYTGLSISNCGNLLGLVKLKVMDASLNCPMINQ